MFELLENRRMFASFVLTPAEFGGEILTISTNTGNKADVVQLVSKTISSKSTPQLLKIGLTCNGKYQAFSHKSFSWNDHINIVVLKTGAGDDSVNIINHDNFIGYGPLLKVNAGSGNDTVICTGGFCVAEGGSGNDILVGRTDKKTFSGYLAFSFDGGKGDDILIGTKFSDALNGGSGKNTIISNGGDDYIPK